MCMRHGNRIVDAYKVPCPVGRDEVFMHRLESCKPTTEAFENTSNTVAAPHLEMRYKPDTPLKGFSFMDFMPAQGGLRLLLVLTEPEPERTYALVTLPLPLRVQSFDERDDTAPAAPIA